MKSLIFLLFFIPIFCFGQAIPGCYNYVAQTPITATSNSTISGFSINCNGAATVGITIPAGVHDVHITKCKVFNSTTANGLINIGAGCYNITIDTCFLQSGWRGIYAVGATNNIHISNNYFYNIIDPNVTATASPDGGGASVQLNACTGTSIQILDNRSFHDISGAGIGDQFSLYKCNGTAASPIRVCRNQALNGSTNPPNTGYAGAVGGDGGGSYQRLDSNIFVNVGAVGAQVQGGHDIEMSYNTIFIAQASYTSVGIAFGNYSGLASSNVTISYNNTRCLQPSGSVFNYWFDTKTAFSPTGWSTNTTSTGLNANILPNPLWAACNITVLAPNISYSPATYTFTMGVPITPFTPTNTGSIAAFTSTLPAGLTINPSTGTISGTPTIGSPPANYTVTAINTSGSCTATINIGVISTDASLTTMAISSGTLSPVFCGCTSNYTASVPNSTTSITLTPTVNQANATVTVNGILVTSGSASGAISLVAGANTINTVVTAQNGSKNTYTVIVTRAPATDATLSALTISNGTLTPVFGSSTTSYLASVDNTITSIALTPIVNQANATVTVNGTPVTSGSASNAINLVVGSNIITTVVTAQDGTTKKTYTVMVTRPAAVSTITFNALANATYGDSPVILSASSNNTDAGATITYTSDNPSVTTVSGNTVTIVGAGLANITARQAATLNFNAAIDVSQTLTVNKANLTITANDQSKFYGFPFTFSGTEFIVQGVLKSDAVNAVTLSSGGTNVSADPGPYPITVSAATGSGLSNYNINYVAGTLTVNGITLNFDPIPSKVYSTADFSPGATSNTPITYTSSNPGVATIVSGNIHIVGVGTSVITSISGAVSQTQTLTVTPAPLTITANNVNKTYGATLTGSSSSTAFTASGLQNGETIGNVAIAYNAGAAANDAVATYTGSVIPSAATGGTFNPVNYDITYIAGDIIIGQATIDITAKNAAKVYGETQTFTDTEFTATGLLNGDAIASVTLTSDGAAARANVNSYDIIPSAAVGGSGTDLSNYKIIYRNGTDVVSPASLTITANNATKVYGTTKSFAGTEFTADGLMNGDVINTVTLTSAGVPASAPVNNYDIIPSNPVADQGTSLSNYIISYVKGTDAVGTALLTITADDQSIAFGDAMPTLTASYSGFVNGETAANLTTLPAIITVATAGSPVGIYIINVSGAVDNNYAFSYMAGNLSINAIPFTFNNIPSKIYGAPDFDPGAVSSSPISYTSSNIAVATIVSGNIHIVGAGSTTITADDGTNQFSRTLTVTPATLSIAADNQSKIYGSANPVLTVSYNGFVNGDTPTSLTAAPAVTTTATTGSPVSTYPINVSGAVDENYNISYNAGTLTVGQAPLVITADDQSKTQGSVNPTLTASYSGFVNGNTKASLSTQPTIATTALTSSPIGTYSITVSGAADANYNITYNAGTLTVGGIALSFGPIPAKIYGTPDFNPGATSSSTITYTSSNPAVATISGNNIHIVGAGTSTITANDGVGNINQALTVTPAALTITADNQSKTYGAANPILTLSYNGFVNGENEASLTTPPIVLTTAATSSVVGTYSITASSAIDANYNITYAPGTLTIGQAPLIITANNQSKIAGAVNPALTVSYNGFVNGDTQASLTTPPTVTTTATTVSLSGTYPITASGAVDPNYNISYVQGTLTVTGTALTFAPIPSEIYGIADFNPGATSSSSITYTSSNPAVATISGSNIHIVGSGTSTITANDGVSNLSQTLTVTPVALVITANSQSKTYGSANPALTLSYSGFVNGDTQASLTAQPTVTTTASASSSVGTYPITVAGAVSANYTITYNAGTLTVGKAALAITAVNQSKTYGAVNPTLTVSYSGFVNGDTQTSLTPAPTVSTTATILSGVGTYPITASGAVNGNYNITYTAGALTVGKATLTITANNQSKTQGTVNPTLTVSYTGFVNSDTQANLTTQPTVTTTAVTASSVGTYPITANGAVSANYSFTYVQGTLTVTGASLTFGPIPSKVYGTSDFSPGATGGTITYTSSNTAVATIVSGNIHIVGVGTSSITANNGSTSLSQTLTVTRAALSVTANIVNKTYGAILTGGAGSAAFTSAGLVNGQTIGSVTIAYGTGSAATAAVGTFTGSVTPSAATGGTFTASNYNITYNTGNIVVGQAALSITANNVSKAYGTAISGNVGSSAFTSTGLVNGQTIGSVTIAYGTGSAATAAVATYTGSVTPSAATGSTFTAANYTITYNTGNIVVGRAALTITANNKTKVQGAANPALTVSYSGFVNGQTNSVLTTQPTVTTTAVTGSPAGTYPITASGAAAANYTISYVQGTLTVTAASTLTFAAIPSKVYGAANFSPGATTTTGTITYTSSNAAVATIVSGNIHIVGVGTSTITASNGSSSLQQTLTVTKATLNILAYNINKTYGSTLTNGAGLTYFTPTGLQYGQTIGTVTITFGTGASATSAAGTYTGSVVASAATGGTFTPANYTITYASGNIIVNKAALTITANNVTKTYGAAITGGTGSKAFTTTGLQNGQTISSVTIAYGTGAAATANAGSYAGSVTPSAATGGTFIAADYTITYVSGNITVGQAALKITANNQTKVQGRANPTLTVSYTGFVNGQTNTSLTTQPKVTTTATTNSPIGTYPITASGAVGANYAITHVAGTLTVTASAGTLMVAASDISLMSVNSEIAPSIAPMEPVVKQALSPNGDGINDVLIIENIESYPDNRVVLMNRNGNTIYEINGYNNSNKVFDGHSNITRTMQPPGTYFYLLEYKVKGELRHKTDYFVIKY